MKIRIGFVSNSSSSCFICGAWLNNEYNIKEITDILQKMLDFYNDLEDEDLTFAAVFENPKVATDSDIDFLKSWGVKKTRIKDKILINSTSDNTIPYMLFDMIKIKFNAERIHLG